MVMLVAPKRIADRMDLVAINKKKSGFVYSDYGNAKTRDPSRRRKWNQLHKVNCSRVLKLNIKVPLYYFETIQEASEWLRANEREYQRAGCCFL